MVRVKQFKIRPELYWRLQEERAKRKMPMGEFQVWLAKNWDRRDKKDEKKSIFFK